MTLSELFSPAAMDAPHPFLKDSDGGALMMGEPHRSNPLREPLWRKWQGRSVPVIDPKKPVARKESFLDRQRKRAGITN